MLDDVRVPADQLLGGVEGRGLQQVLSALECGRINIAGPLGRRRPAAPTTRRWRYTQERHAFGQPIAEFQAIQLKLADMATDVQAARLMTYWAATRSSRGTGRRSRPAMAKLFAPRWRCEAALESMRVHGGYGYSTEFDVERLYRDAPLMGIGEGTNDILRTVIAKALVRGQVTV